MSALRKKRAAREEPSGWFFRFYSRGINERIGLTTRWNLPEHFDAKLPMKISKRRNTADFRSLKAEAFEANLALVHHQLVILTWGNASALDPLRGVMAIKPSGVPYAELRATNMVVLELETGAPVEKTSLRPSSDTPTHLRLYQVFSGLGGIVHTHSRQATAWAQAGRDLPCLGTTHADYFYGPVPCTAGMTAAEIKEGQGYEHNTAEVIIREFQERGLDSMKMPAVLVRSHAPFIWGKTAADAVQHAVVLEEVAGLALQTIYLSPQAKDLPPPLLDKHFQRKHGAEAYYGQGKGC
jgi:L-ribulose-5-phosphate 4-epimerase